MSSIGVTPLARTEIGEAASAAASAFAPTPFTMAIVGDAQRAERLMPPTFRVMFGDLAGDVFVAKDDGRVVGVMRMVEWPKCQLTALEKLRILPGMLRAGPGVMLRGMEGRSTWSRSDPKTAHWHLDPLVVVPDRQGQGIGSRLLREFCARVDQTGRPAYLETDRPENVELYQRFGFHVTKEAAVVGVQCYFMWRPSREDLNSRR